MGKNKKEKSQLTVEDFITTLKSFYDDSVPGTSFCCRFFLQATTFSYELHDQRRACFTPGSLIFESETYWWGEVEENQQILDDILAKAKELNEQKNNANIGDVEV